MSENCKHNFHPLIQLANKETGAMFVVFYCAHCLTTRQIEAKVHFPEPPRIVQATMEGIPRQ